MAVKEMIRRIHTLAEVAACLFATLLTVTAFSNARGDSFAGYLFVAAIGWSALMACIFALRWIVAPFLQPAPVAAGAQTYRKPPMRDVHSNVEDIEPEYGPFGERTRRRP